MNCKFCYGEIIITDKELHENYYPSFCSDACLIAWADLMESEVKNET